MKCSEAEAGERGAENPSHRVNKVTSFTYRKLWEGS